MERHECEYCGKEMGFEWFLGPVCGRCVREQHRRAVAGLPSLKRRESTDTSERS